MSMTPATRAHACSILNNAVDDLSAWERHFRNPAKYAKPKTKIAAVTTRLSNLDNALARHGTTEPTDT